MNIQSLPPAITSYRWQLAHQAAIAPPKLVKLRSTRDRCRMLTNIDDQDYNFVMRNRYTSMQTQFKTHIKCNSVGSLYKSMPFRAHRSTLSKKLDKIEKVVGELSMKVHHNNIRFIGGNVKAYPSTPLIQLNYVRVLLRRKTVNALV